MGDSYPKVKATMVWLLEDNRMDSADGTFATSWETAYPLYNSKNNTQRFYFVQDFEPYFYPASSFFELAENTYRFGFYGITAGKWLSTKLHNDYRMETDYFDFGSDEKLYSFDNFKLRNEIFCYVRPYTERRGFEIAIMALDVFHKKHPEFIINLAGWDVSNYDIPFPYNNLKILEVSELNSLYNKCAAGLVISLTNMSLMPLELLRSGAIPVVNEGNNNKLVSNNKYIAYAKTDPQSLANKLSEIVSKPDIIQYAKSAAKSVNTFTWEDSGKKFVTIAERETRKT
jgi:glycosyltransferase involved in cell wall biosynthesis